MSGYLEHLSDNIRVDQDKCVFCGKCVNTCVLDNLRMKLSPCRQACPMGVNVQGYVQLILRGEDDKARDLIREKLPFPEVMCMVCNHPCEQACERGKSGDQPVNIRGLKRYLFDSEAGRAAALPKKAELTGKKAAIVGAGPAGLVAAWDLALKGHDVTVFEAEASAGGELRHGIPAFRLAADMVERELAVLPALGVQFRFNTRVGKKLPLDTLTAEFDAVILATGLNTSKHLGVVGEGLSGVLDGIGLLAAARTGTAPAMKGKVVVIGGGNVAVDTAMTALRQGASSVTMVCLESEAEIPAFPGEVQMARSEGITFDAGWGPLRFTEKNGKLAGVELRRCVSVFDENKAFAPRYDESCKKTLDADFVVVAIGQSRDAGVFEGSSAGLERLAATHPVTRQCGEKLFVAGDVLTGATSVVGAMAQGREAAESVHRLLCGEPLAYGRTYAGPFETEFSIDKSRGTATNRQNAPVKTCTGAGDYTVTEGCLSEKEARAEASRCYSCGGPFGKHRNCWFCLPCEVECPEKALYVEIPYLLR